MKKAEQLKLIFPVALQDQMSFLLAVRAWLILPLARGALGLKARGWTGWRVQAQYDASMLFPIRTTKAWVAGLHSAAVKGNKDSQEVCWSLAVPYP